MKMLTSLPEVLPRAITELKITSRPDKVIPAHLMLTSLPKVLPRAITELKITSRPDDDPHDRM